MSAKAIMVLTILVICVFMILFSYDLTSSLIDYLKHSLSPNPFNAEFIFDKIKAILLAIFVLLALSLVLASLFELVLH